MKWICSNLYMNPLTGMIEFEKEDTDLERVKKQTDLSVLEKRDRKCRSQIIQRIADSHLEYVKDKESAFSMWNSLRQCI